MGYHDISLAIFNVPFPHVRKFQSSVRSLCPVAQSVPSEVVSLL